MNRLRVASALAAGLLATTSGCAELRGARSYHRGTEALDRGEVALAVAELEGAAERVPRASEVHNHLGLAYAAAGRHDDALAAWRRAVELDCDNEAAQRNLAAALRRAEAKGP